MIASPFRITLGLLLLLLTACSTQRDATTVTRPANAEMVSMKKKSVGTVETESEHKTAGKKSSDAALVNKYASKLNTEKSDLNITLLRFIDDWYATPYKYGGKSKNGVDCSSFTCTLYNDVYQREASGTSLELYNTCKKIKRSDLQQGDLVFFRIYKNRVSHVGVYVANNYFVHASTKAGVVLSSLDEEYYRKHYAGGGRLK
jgi:murein DD-endopeptidase / murein LD-carboxypeptidase